VFEVHGEAEGQIVLRQRLRRAQVETFFAKLPPCVIGMEACGSAHYWARVLRRLGHEVRLIPAAYVKPFVRRNKTDARDAAAICAALQRPDMRFVPVKSVEQQAARALERSRDLLVKQHTQLTNSLRGQVAEFGVIAAAGPRGVAALRARIAAADELLPKDLLPVLQLLLRQIDQLEAAVASLDKRIVATARRHPVMRQLSTIPGVGPLTAHAIVTAVGDGRQFASGRDFAAWCGLTQRVDQSAETRRRRGLSRQGEMRLRKLLALGASAVLRQRRQQPERATPWQRAILARRPIKVAVLAQAAKTARTAWAILVRDETYQPQRAASRSLATAP
jgi:transposase